MYYILILITVCIIKKILNAKNINTLARKEKVYDI